jgi:glycine hydroxymethyltransferase
MSETILTAFARQGVDLLRQEDPALCRLLEQEYERQTTTLAMVASSSIVDPSVLACEGTVPVNVTAEGYPGRRFHAGCQFIDEIEQLAIDRAKAAFKAQYANVQPHSASLANEIVMFSLLKPGDTILGMQLQYGGHLTHGAKASISGRYFNAIGYGLNEEGFIDYDQVSRLAHEVRPRLIICGATAYPRIIDFRRFREIADEVGAFLLADITHTAGLVVAGLHPSPIDHAHFTTTCTHKQLYGPRGGLILIGRDSDNPSPDGRSTLAELMQSAVFPMVQGAPIPNMLAAKARALARVVRPEFHILAKQIIANGRALAACFVNKGYPVVSGGSDNHIVLLDVAARGLTGLIAERALEACNVIVNKNKIPGDKKSTLVTSGIRLGTNSVARRGMGAAEMKECANLIDKVLGSLDVFGDYKYALGSATKESVQDTVRQLCRRFPIPYYPMMLSETSLS